MENTNQREKLIEDAAKAMFEASPPNNPHGPSSDLAFDEPYTRDYSAKLRVLAEAALAVFEGAYTPTDDEREALDSFRGWTPLEVKNAPYQAARVISTLLYKLERRTMQGEHQKMAIYDGNETVCVTCPKNSYGEYVAWDQAHPQGEPSDAQVLAALEAYAEYREADGPGDAMRAALRAAAETI